MKGLIVHVLHLVSLHYGRRATARFDRHGYRDRVGSRRWGRMTAIEERLVPRFGGVPYDDGRLVLVLARVIFRDRRARRSS
jgi:hypothetical protein